MRYDDLYLPKWAGLEVERPTTMSDNGGKPRQVSEREPTRWICCECKEVNRAHRINCRSCNKPRWFIVLGLDEREAEELSKHIYAIHRTTYEQKKFRTSALTSK